MQEDRDDAVSKAGIDTTMVQDDVIASPAATMQHTLKHLRSKYGNIEGYLKVRCLQSSRSIFIMQTPRPLSGAGMVAVGAALAQ